MTHRIRIAAAVLALAFPAAAQDQKPPTPPPLQHEIVVTATRLETPAKEVASSITVITRSEIERSVRSNVLDLIQDGLGAAAVRNGGPGAASSFFLRGANSEHVLVLLDGVELNDPMNPSRSYDLAHMSLDGVERIEVLRGPQSTLYGSDALAGVINVITRRGSGKPRLSLETSGGSYGTIRSSAALAGGPGPLGFSLGLSHFLTQGFSAAAPWYPGNSEKDGYRNLTASGSLIYAPGTGSEAGLTFRATSARTDLDTFGGPGGDDPNSVQTYASLFLSAHGRTLLFGGRWEMKGALSYVRSDRRNDNPVDAAHPFDSERGRFRSGLVQADWQNNIFLSPAQTLTFGAEIGREQGDSQYVSQSQWGPYESLFPHRSAERAGFFVQDQVRFGGNFFATAGLRADVHSRTGTAVTYRLAPAYIIEATGTKLKATIGTGFKSPSLYQLYAPGTFWGPVGNETLRPEESLGWDAGVEQAFLGGRIQTGLSYFRNDFRNLIDFDPSRGYINIGRARTRGIEAFAGWRPAESFDLRLSYTSLNAVDLDDGSPLLRRPKDKTTADFRIRPADKWELRIAGTYVGRRSDRDFNVWPYPLIALHRYFLADADVTYNLSALFQVFLRADNLLDERYETVYGYGTPRLSAYAGVRIKL